uniref:Uncharacterized protein n=1 Tax=Marseillevirus LCMAC101 TaxID=2506602 RepID=A0A481YQY2_9VIRU|nr:MAG: uncharacterized protein LCMAC101_00560 [Marseillevirus LCMAC101]
MDPQQKWTKNLTKSLIESVSISIGGDNEKKWYCNECGQSHGTASRPKVCGLQTSKYNETKAFHLIASAYKEWHDGEREIKTLEEFRDFRQNRPGFMETLEREENINSDEDFYDEETCVSENFEFVKREGIVVDRFDREYLELLNEFSRLPSKGYSSLCGQRD